MREKVRKRERKRILGARLRRGDRDSDIGGSVGGIHL